jgi:hypothetical protein
MLTEDGYRNRFWQGYPHLRRLLERKDDPIPHGADLRGFFDDDEPRTSVDHGSLGRLTDVIAIARLLASQGLDIQHAMRVDTSSTEVITEEIRQLLDELEGRVHALRQRVARACDREVDDTRAVARDVQELGRHLRSARQVRSPNTDGGEKT